jgi:hypothetical protein
MTIFFKRLGLALILLAAVCNACGKKAPALGPINPAAFDNAPAEIKEMWDRALAQGNNKEFSAAILTLRAMGRPASPTREQWEAMHNAVLKYENELRAKAQTGDESARADMEKLGVSPNPPKQ